MNTDVIKKILHYIDDPIIISFCRKLSNQWNNEILNSSDEFINKYKQITQLFDYDRKKYDEHYYKRQIIRNELGLQFNIYKRIMIPVITYETFEEEEVIKKIGVNPLPLEIKIFLGKFLIDPHTQIELLPANFINDITKQQCIAQRENIISDNPLDDVLYTPICLSKHHKINNRDKQYIAILCFVNIMNLEIEFQLPFIDERFITFEFEVSDLKKYESDIQKFILEMLKKEKNITVISANMCSLPTAFKFLLEKFHL